MLYYILAMMTMENMEEWFSTLANRGVTQLGTLLYRGESQLGTLIYMPYEVIYRKGVASLMLWL